MRFKRVNIDSLNLGDMNLEGLFINHEDYIVELVKSRSEFKPKTWINIFNKSLTRNVIRACIIHTNLGLTLPLKTQSRNQKIQVIEFAGLYGYNERSKLLKIHLKDLWSHLQHTRLIRIDISIDWEKIPSKVFKALKADREPFKWFNSTYFKTPKEGKKNYYINIVAYDKAKKENLSEPMERLEFSFGSVFFKDMLLKDLPKAIKKMEKSITKKIGIKIKITPIFSHA